MKKLLISEITKILGEFDEAETYDFVLLSKRDGIFVIDNMNEDKYYLEDADENILLIIKEQLLMVLN